jgi:hypothetical protein
VTNVRAIFLLLLVTAIAGCGKKGAPLPPLIRIPAVVGKPEATRVEDDVFIRFQVPTTNVDGEAPADIARVEVYAITANRQPTDQDDPEDLRQLSTLVAAEPVRPPLPPVPPAEPDEPPPPVPLAGPGVDQGSELVVRETLTTDAHTEISLPALPGDGDDDESQPVFGPLLAPLESGGPTRYYYAVGVSASGRYGPAGSMLPVPLGPTSGAPGLPQLTHDETTIYMRWLPPRDARGLGGQASPDVLPSKPTMPGPPPTTYDVFEVKPGSNQTPAMPAPVTPAPVAGLALSGPLGAFAVERCFYVRSVDIIKGRHVRGPASPVACITPKDTYAPKPPHSLAAIATQAAINLIWEPSDSPDVVGYLVLRARLPDDTLQPTTDAPVSGTTLVDKGVRAGVTYAYVVVAVDKAGNRSEPSNRVEETAR